MNLSQAKLICQRYDLMPSKSRGQNFLIDQNIVSKIIKSAEITSTDIILEVGPGLGILTGQLLKVAAKVVAVELDKKAVVFLKAEFSADIEKGRLTLVEADILKFNPADYGLKPFAYKIVANLPYNITSLFIKNFLETTARPSAMILMVQKEVAQRIVAKPGEMSLLALSVQFYAQPRLVFTVDPGCFWPQPKVDSAVIYLNLNKKIPTSNIKGFFRVAKVGFAAKRKKLIKNLAGGLKLDIGKIREIFEKLGLDENIRAQNLSLEQWVDLEIEIGKLDR